jgi:two-component system sensor histidine kinase/response regulator
VFMDIKMPRMDGLEAMRQIRSSPGGASVRIVALSASIFDEATMPAASQGANAFLAKPVRPAQIWGVIEAELGVHFGGTLEAPAEAQEEPTREQIAAVDRALLATLRSAVENGDLDRANELLLELDERHRTVVMALQKRLAAFDVAGVLALTGTGRGS